uniref:Nucleotide-diphospho-sugar transferase domain-containing protein n=1 Tax=viral metagenome TaxID=1070528 RepID=A0A6M3J2J9_9ZZZZ
MKKIAFTAVEDKRYYPIGTHIFVNSFKKFHPDIDLAVIRQDVVDKMFKEKGIDWYCAKPFMAELFFDYDLIVNMDADHVLTGRMTEVFDNVDYEVGGPWNFNDYENASFDNITEEMYVQCGMIASTSKKFWLKWQEMNKDNRKYLRRENDIVNLVIYNAMPELKLKIFDKDKDYYGCKSLGREPEFYIKDDKLMCRGEQILAYHFARGGVLPKLDFENMALIDEVKQWLHKLSYGQSYKMVGI